MSVSVFRVKNFDPSIFTLSTMQTNKFGGKTIYINTPDRKHVHLQTPKMKGSVTKYQPDDPKTGKPNGPAKYSLRLSFGKEPIGMVQQYREILRKWDEKLIKQGQENCADWFRKKAGSLDYDVVKNMYSPMLSVSIDKNTLEEDGKYPDAVKFKIEVNEDGSFAGDVAVFDEDQSEIKNVNQIPPGCHVIAIVKCTGVWFAAGKFGISWRVAQMQIFKPQRVSGFSILPDLDPEPENEPQMQTQALNNGANSDEVPEPPEDVPTTQISMGKTVKKGGDSDTDDENAQTGTSGAPVTAVVPPTPVEDSADSSAEKKKSKKKPAPAAKKGKKALLEDF